MSNARGHKGFAPLIDISAVGRAVNAAIKTAPRPSRKRKSPVVVKASRADRMDFDRKFASAFVHVQYHIHPTGIGFEVWDVHSHKVVATFDTFTRAKRFVEDRP